MLSASQLAILAENAGFTGAEISTAVAIALAESGGNPNAYNPEPAAGTPQGYGSYGLWQIYLKAHPEFAGEDLNDPQTNADLAYQVYAQSGFSSWSTFNSGKYLAFLDEAQTALPSAAQPAQSNASVASSLPASPAAPPVQSPQIDPLMIAGILFAGVAGIALVRNL